MWLVTEDKLGYRLFIDETTDLTDRWPAEVWRYLTDGQEIPSDDNPWSTLSKPLYIIVPTSLADRLSFFMPEFRVVYADPDHLYLVHHRSELPDWLGTATRRCHVILWDASHRYILLEKLLDGTTYHLPGGHASHHESSVEAVVREVNEELHYAMDPEKLIPITTVEFHPTKYATPFDQFQVIFYYEYQTDLNIKDTTLVIDPTEVGGIVWVKPVNIKTLTVTSVTKVLIDRWPTAR